ncbi:hypothetical protein G6F42_027051 [Rhizopus arrhizus]|nr:hypothetical protein G6F42_027051 [Rhizopus arrhizus]
MCKYHNIQPSWSDHFLVTSHFALRSPTHATILGKGVWRAHPRLASSETFQALVAHTIFTTVSAFDPHLSPQDKWDKVKTSVAHAAKSFSRRSAFTLTKAESLLHRKRSGIVNRLAANASLCVIS